MNPKFATTLQKENCSPSAAGAQVAVAEGVADDRLSANAAEAIVSEIMFLRLSFPNRLLMVGEKE